MRIVVNDIAASSGGALTVLKSFYNHVKSSKKGMKHEWIFLLNADFLEETDNIKIIVINDVKKNWINRLRFDLINGKKIISELKPDIVFSLQNTITFRLKCPQVLYLHQSIPFQKVKSFSFIKAEERKLAVYQYLIGTIIKQSIKKADKTIVQTKWMKDSVVNAINISSNNIINISPNQDDYSKFKREGVFNSRSFFYPASNELYKNHECIYNACEILSNIGVEKYKVSLTIEEVRSTNNISCIGTLTFQQVLEEYNVSTLIFPSYIETLGLPLIEARQMGTIILASDCAFSREALEGYENAYFFDPFKPYELANLMQKVIEHQIIKNEKVSTTNVYSDGWEPVISLLEQIGGGD
ncbi:glycosyltransferase [Peribacillus butanolivorans]|uniref:Glycosyltransferase n=1 Tax=Peribacillus butanolivorans TaxID=421767 RepID=A0AAX0RVR0_9BACI|nr:glycosyltransferase [Peribacillus butanolivorans]PEJ25953.1 glycosyltransferase [Peribacillus butanolivorans]